MSRYSLSLTIGIVLVAGIVLVTQWPRDPAPATPVAVPAPVPVPAPAADSPATTPSASPPSDTSAAPVPASPPKRVVSLLDTQFREATDYLAFARSLLPRAQAGDRDAQYDLYVAMDYCRDGYLAYFDQGQQRRSLAEALELAANAPARTREEISRVHSRCRALMESGDEDLAEAESWLTRAAARGHPRAQIEQAARMARTSANLPASRQDRSLAEARRMARESLASRDPAVIWKLGSLAPLRGDARAGTDMDAAAFARAACERGLDCGPGSAAAEEWCRQVPDCQPSESVEDMLLRTSADPSRVAERARQINAQIDAGDWQGLGLAEPPRP